MISKKKLLNLKFEEEMELTKAQHQKLTAQYHLQADVLDIGNLINQMTRQSRNKITKLIMILKKQIV